MHWGSEWIVARAVHNAGNRLGVISAELGLEPAGQGGWPWKMVQNPFRYFKTSPAIIQLGVLMYVRFPLSFPNVEDLLHELGIDVYHERVRLWSDRFGTYFADKIRKRMCEAMRQVKG